MTANEFMKDVQSAFGAYTADTRDVVERWAGRQDDDYRQSVFNALITEFEAKGFPPKLGEIYTVLRRAGLASEKTEGRWIFVSRCEFCGATFPVEAERCQSCGKEREYGGIIGLPAESPDAGIFRDRFKPFYVKYKQDQEERVRLKKARMAEGKLPPEELARSLVKKSLDKKGGQ